MEVRNDNRENSQAMRKVIFLFVSLLLSVVSLSQPTAVGLIAGMEDQSCLAAADSQGEIFVAGTTTSTVTVNSTLYSVSGWDDIFVARISSAGSILWYKQFGSSNPFWEDFFETPDINPSGRGFTINICYRMQLPRISIRHLQHPFQVRFPGKGPV